jgi:hypothetical protein
MLSARELNTDNIQNRSWVSERLNYTHGYGVTLGPVNQVTTEGLPVLFIQNLPPVSSVNIKLDQPSIYYGELTKGYALVKTKQKEFDYPKGDDNVQTVYGGTGGVPVASLLRRLAFAIRFGSTDILFTTQFTNRQPHLVLPADLGTRAAARAIPRVRRRSVSGDQQRQALLDAGRVHDDSQLSVLDAQHVIALRRDQLHPQLGQDRHGRLQRQRPALRGRTGRSAHPDGAERLSGHVASAVRHARRPAPPHPLPRGHLPGAGAGLRRVPHDQRGGLLQQRGPVADPAADRRPERLADAAVLHHHEVARREADRVHPDAAVHAGAKDNLSAWMVARSDAEHYGRLLVFQFPKQKIVYGPRQIEGRINQDQEISPQITLWNQQGSEVRWGDLLVIPINESLIYVRPLYLRSSERGIPELKRVVVAYQSQIEMAETLTLGLAKIFGNGVTAALAPDRLASDATSVVETSTGVEPPPATAATGR